MAERVRAVAITAIFVLAGIPELVELLFNLADGHIDTHVLMTLAVMGTLAIGSALEVCPCSDEVTLPWFSKPTYWL